MAGLIFYRTKKYTEVVKFYKDNMNMKIWLEQGECTILQKDNFLLGFCDRDESDTDGMITFFFEDKNEVDYYYSLFKETALDTPKKNSTYKIYHFFTRDPEGRMVEFQTFLHRVKPFHEGRTLLQNRRSIRKYSNDEISKEVLKEVFEQCRFVPTSCNTQAYKYLLIRDKETIDKLALVRENSSAPLGKAPLSVVVYVDPEGTKRPEQDGSIASTYLLLAAAQHGLGTCWVGGMDTEEVKKILNINQKYHISMISPLGWPDEKKVLPERRTLNEMVIGI